MDSAIMKNGGLESAFHMSVADYLKIALPPEIVWSTFPAGGGGRVRGGKLKASGLIAGFPDIILLKPCHVSTLVRFIGIELKTDRGRLSPAQRDVHQRILDAGGFVHICRSLAEVEGALRAEMIPLRAKMSA